MKAIHKYHVPKTDCGRVELPLRSKILSVAKQHDWLVLYALVDKTVKETEPITVYVIDTDCKLPKGFLDKWKGSPRFMGTFSTLYGTRTLHVFVQSENGKFSFWTPR